ncbi:MAG TPA: ABC transporter permease [Actinoplanes sp.]|nr:ABC transporter permease [Actinoplanes sp.]
MAVSVSPATFVRLKLRITVNGLRGQTWRAVLFVFGTAMAVGFAAGGYAIFAVPGLLNDGRVAGMLLTLGGAAIVLGWLFLPLIFFGVDESLDPARFALLPLNRRTLIGGLFVASLAGVPAAATLVATLGMIDTAARIGGMSAALAEAVGVVLGLLLCAAVSRSVTSAFATALRSRRARDLATVLLAVVAALLGPLQIAALAGAQHADWDRVADVAEVIGWTPLGAGYSLGPEVAAGRTWAVPVKLLILVLSILGLLRWWSMTLERAMLGAAGTHASGAVGATSGRPAVGRLVFRWLPSNRFGALVSRETRYWWRESRRRASLITLSVVGVFLPVMLSVTGGGAGAMLVFVGALAAVSLANQFGFEGSAYAANIVAGVPGRLEVQSRVAAFSIYIVPLLVVIAVVVGVAAGRPAGIAAQLGMLLASYGVGLAGVLPVSVRAAYALPDSANPFAMSSGGGLAKGLLTMGALLVAVVATLPVQLASFLLGDVWLWIGLPVGVLYGGTAAFVGSRLAGDLLDRRMPELLAAVTPNRS